MTTLPRIARPWPLLVVVGAIGAETLMVGGNSVVEAQTAGEQVETRQIAPKFHLISTPTANMLLFAGRDATVVVASSGPGWSPRRSGWSGARCRKHSPRARPGGRADAERRRRLGCDRGSDNRSRESDLANGPSRSFVPFARAAGERAAGRSVSAGT